MDVLGAIPIALTRGTSLSPPPLRKAVTTEYGYVAKNKVTRINVPQVTRDDSAYGTSLYANRNNLMNDIVSRNGKTKGMKSNSNNHKKRQVRRRSSFNTTTDLENDLKSPKDRLRAFFQTSVKAEDSDEEDYYNDMNSSSNNNNSISRGFKAFFKLKKKDNLIEDDDEDDDDDYLPSKRSKSPIREFFGVKSKPRNFSETDSDFFVATSMSKYDD